MILGLVLAACTVDPQVDDTDSDTAVGDCPTGTAWFQGSEGDPSDVTSELDALTLDQDGTLTFCGGGWVALKGVQVWLFGFFWRQ